LFLGNKKKGLLSLDEGGETPLRSTLEKICGTRGLIGEEKKKVKEVGCF